MLELLDGARERAHQVAHVDLDHLGARTGARVGQGAGGADHVAAAVDGLVERQVGVGEGRVAQTIAEGEERIGAVVQIVGRVAQRGLARLGSDLVEQFLAAIGTAGHVVAVVHRHLAHRPQEGDGGLAGGRGVAEDEVGERRAAHRAGMEAVEHRPAVRQVALDGERPAGHHRGHDRLAGGLQRGQQLALGALQVEVGERMGFARKDGFLAEESQDHVRAAGGGHDVVEARPLLAAVLQPGHVDYPARETLPQRRERRDGVLFLAVEGPGAQLVVGRVGHRAGDEDRPHAAGVQREDAVVLEQDGGLLRGAAGGVQVLRRVLDRLRGSGVHVGMLEQAEEDLDAQDVAHGVVDGGFPDLAGADQLLQVGDEPVGHHVHVHPGVQRLPRHFAAVGAIAVGNHLAHRVPVRDNQTVEAPFTAQDVPDHEFVARRGHAVVVVERSHQRQRARLDGRLEGRQVDVAQLVFRQEGAVVVAPALGGAVAHEVLDARRHRGRVPLRALVAAHHGLAHPGVQPGVLAAAFRHAAPAGVAGDVEHRREGPADALRRRLDGGHAGALLHQRRVEGRGEAQRDRENRMETVDHVASNQQGDREPRLFSTPPSAETWFIWPIFSARVICARSCSTRRSTSGVVPTVDGRFGPPQAAAARHAAARNKFRIVLLFMFYFWYTRT